MSIFWVVNVNNLESNTLSALVTHLKWGSNRDIRTEGFRVLQSGEDLRFFKSIPVITDPAFILTHGMKVLKLNATSVCEVTTI